MSDVLTERYGGSGAGRRRTVVAASGVVGVLALAWLGWAVWFQSTPDVQSSLRTWRVVDTHQVTAEVAVNTRSSDVTASCLLRATAEDHSVVGERNFAVPGTGTTVTRRLGFRTEREATAVELVGCTTPDQNRPR